MILSLNLGTQARKEKKQKEKGVVLDIMGCVARVLWALLCTAPLQGYTGGSRGKGGLGGCNPPIPHGLLRGKPKQAKTLSGVGKWQPSLEKKTWICPYFALLCCPLGPDAIVMGVNPWPP